MMFDLSCSRITHGRARGTAKKSLTIIAGLAAVILFANTATADPMLTFDVVVGAAQTGQLSYAGGDSPLVGTDILVDSVTGINTPLNTNVTQMCVGCLLSFNTGPLSGTTGAAWFFNAGGFISITGSVPG